MGAILTTVCILIKEVCKLIRCSIQQQSCRVCTTCKDYNDEAFFTTFKEQSYLPTYADTVIASGKLDTPLLCCQCGHERQYHGELTRRILTADLLPNGGVVYTALHVRAERERRTQRAQRLNSGNNTNTEVKAATESGSETQTEAGSTAGQTEQNEVISVDTRVGKGRIVSTGDDVLFHYDGFVKQTKEQFDTSRDRYGKGFRMTVGRGDVVPGLDKGIIGMAVGGERRMVIPHHLAFGGDEIIGIRNVDVIFVIELLAILSN